MCGIAGILNFDNKPVSKTMLKKMTDAIVHRGPDDEGLYVKDNVGLGHRRLSIIDLSQRAHQPMCNEDGTVWIVYNGEIYNYQELNKKYLLENHQIKSNCDTETIIHLWEEFGPKCVDHLRGMFSFAIWDETKKTFFAAVDRLRIKPFYFTESNGSFVFSSELKSILESGLYQGGVNFEGIHHYLSMQAIPVPLTIYENIFTLPGGYAMEVKDGKVSVYQYWDVEFETNDGYSESYYQKQLKDLVTESIEMRMMSDVPLGAFLSGGIDSSIIVAVMKNISENPVKTFSIGYDIGGAEWDDTRYAKLVSEKYSTDHKVKIVTAKDVLDEMENFIYYLDQPSTDAINSYFVSQLAAQDVTVVQCGQGGDELFAGYFTFDVIEKYFKRDQAWDKIPPFLRKAIVGTHSKLSPLFKNLSVSASFDNFLNAYGSFSRKYAKIRMELDETEKLRTYTDLFRDRIGDLDTINIYDKYDEAFGSGKDIINKVSYFDLKTHLGDVLMRDVDTMSMAFSLETRIPLIDHKLVEFVAKMPTSLKMKNGTKKYIFINAMRDLLPEEVVTRKKRGFAFPLRLWLRRELKPLLEFVLSKENIESRGLFKNEEIQKLKKNYYDWKAPNYRKVWGYAVLEMWMRSNIDKDKSFFKELHHFVSKSMK